MKSTITLVPARPDIFNQEMAVAPLGRAKLFNVTNTVFTTEPFTVRTIKRKCNRLVPSVLRVYLTGVNATTPTTSVTVRIRDQFITGTSILTQPVLVEPGIYYIDFQLPAALQGAGDQPIVVTVTFGTVGFSSRLDDTAARLFIL